MTSYPTSDNHGRWWVTTWASWNRLHAIPATAIDVTDEDALEDFRVDGAVVTAACGITTRMAWPGVFNRLGRPRCTHCCRALGIPPGNGTPANEASRAARAKRSRVDTAPVRGGLL